LGSLQIDTAGQGSLKTGWAKVQADKNVSGISIFSFYDGAGNFISEVGAPATASMNSFSVSVELQTDVDTAIALANPNATPAQAVLTLRNAQGAAVGFPVNLTIPAQGHAQGYLSDLFPRGSVAPGFQGTVDVSSQTPIVGMALRQRANNFTWLPVMP